MKAQTAREVDDEAAAWALRIDSGGLDAPRSPELQAWLDGDPRRAGAYLRAQAALSFLDRGRALEDGAPQAPARMFRPSRRTVLAIGGGGGLVAAGLGVALVVGAAGRRYATELGEIRRVPLQDGSLVDINTASVLDVAMHAHGRNVVLRQGEAWFEVAKDAARPFLVRAGDARIRAVGTAFSVRRLPGQIELLVTEGLVEAWIDGADGHSAMVGAGSKIALRADAPLRPVRAEQEIERSLAWRNGQISLDGETLAAAAAEFNRYNRRALIIEDPALARRQFVGLFRIDDPKSFAAAVAAASGARLEESADAIRLKGLP
jgi:transmembrane sensor